MTAKRIIISVVLIAVLGVGCANQTTWSAQEKQNVRDMAVLFAEDEAVVDCAIDVITDIYSPEDWTYLMSHIGQGLARITLDRDPGESTLPQRFKDMDDEAGKRMEADCGIEEAHEPEDDPELAPVDKEPVFTAEDAQQMLDAAGLGVDPAITAWIEATDEWKALPLSVRARYGYDYATWAQSHGKPTTAPNP